MLQNAILLMNRYQKGKVFPLFYYDSGYGKFGVGVCVYFQNRFESAVGRIKKV